MHTMKSTILLSLVPIGLKLDDNALFEFDDDDDDIFSQNCNKLLGFRFSYLEKYTEVVLFGPQLS